MTTAAQREAQRTAQRENELQRCIRYARLGYSVKRLSQLFKVTEATATALKQKFG
jgi:transposase